MKEIIFYEILDSLLSKELPRKDLSGRLPQAARCSSPGERSPCQKAGDADEVGVLQKEILDLIRKSRVALSPSRPLGTAGGLGCRAGELAVGVEEVFLPGLHRRHCFSRA